MFFKPFSKKKRYLADPVYAQFRKIYKVIVQGMLARNFSSQDVVLPDFQTIFVAEFYLRELSKMTRTFLCSFIFKYNMLEYEFHNANFTGNSSVNTQLKIRYKP